MPLHSQYAAPVNSLYTLNDTIGRGGNNLKAHRDTVHGLMVEGIHCKAFFSKNAVEQAAGSNHDIVCCHATLHGLLIMVKELRTQCCIHVLMYRAAKRCGNGLYATAYTKNWQTAGVGKTGKQQFLFITCRVYAVQ